MTYETGGQGRPDNDKGKFQVKYSDKSQDFVSYQKALAFYDSLDEAAALWDITRIPELCESKQLKLTTEQYCEKIAEIDEAFKDAVQEYNQELAKRKKS